MGNGLHNELDSIFYLTQTLHACLFDVRPSVSCRKYIETSAVFAMEKIQDRAEKSELCCIQNASALHTETQHCTIEAALIYN